METKHKLLFVVFITLLSTTSLSKCSTLHIKLSPEHKGVDPRVTEIVKEYKDLAKIQNINFKRPVTIGFKKINEENTVGLTTYGSGWREIDIDVDYWNIISKTSRLILVFHELTHAYCDREHDYGDGTFYPQTEQERFEEAIEWVKNGGIRPGRYSQDECPISIMYPVILDDSCTLSHYGDYIVEMFNRCSPW